MKENEELKQSIEGLNSKKNEDIKQKNQDKKLSNEEMENNYYQVNQLL